MMQIDHEKGKKKKRDFDQRSLETANSQLQYRHNENKAGAEKIASNKRRRENNQDTGDQHERPKNYLSSSPQSQFFCHRPRLRGRTQHSPTMSHRKNQCEENQC